MKCPGCGEEHDDLELKKFAERLLTVIATMSLVAAPDIPAHQANAETLSVAGHLWLNSSAIMSAMTVLGRYKLRELQQAGKNPIEWFRETMASLGSHGDVHLQDIAKNMN